ncbi:MAG: peptidylprolyl isomerase [Erythrobacter sp.]
MTIRALVPFALAATLALPALAQTETPAPSPTEIVNAAPAEAWVAIPPEDLLVMTLAPDRDGNAREVVIQLMPEPFSQGWIENIRTLARANWYEGISVNRVQDNYVVQWGDPGYDNPEAEGAAKSLPAGLNVIGEDGYVATGLFSIPDPRGRPRMNYALGASAVRNARIAAEGGIEIPDKFREALEHGREMPDFNQPDMGDAYATFATLALGWPIAGNLGGESEGENTFWPVHCYGMVGVGRNLSPDTGTGAELYTVIGHAPRHLDRNIALVGRIVSGMEHLSSLPRGSGALGFYTEEEADLRTPIQSIRVAADLPEDERRQFEYLSTESETFADYAEARANRRDPFFIQPAGGADICNIPVPVRAFEYDEPE